MNSNDDTSRGAATGAPGNGPDSAQEVRGEGGKMQTLHLVRLDRDRYPGCYGFEIVPPRNPLERFAVVEYQPEGWAEDSWEEAERWARRLLEWAPDQEWRRPYGLGSRIDGSVIDHIDDGARTVMLEDGRVLDEFAVAGWREASFIVLDGAD